MNTRGELAGCRLAHPPPGAERQAGNSQSWKTRGNLGPRNGILHQTARRLPVANQYFLGFWTVDNCQEGLSQGLAPQKRHMAHLRWRSHAHPGNPEAGTKKVIRCTAHLRRVHSPSTRSPKLLRPGKGTKCRPNRVCAFVEYLRT